MHPSFDKNDQYIVPNEEPFVIRDMIKYLPVRRAAGICSAGEVGFFSMLPSVKEELVLIDHSYRSLSIAMRKYLLLQEYGWKETYDLLTENRRSVKKLENYLSKIEKKLPKAVKSIESLPPFTIASQDGRMLTYGVREMWTSIPHYELRKAHNKLNLVTFAHGDLTDLIEKGPFDLLYVSNAFAHNGRSNASPRLDEIAKIVKSGGYILEAGSSREHTGWNCIKRFQGTRSSYLYKLYQFA